MLVVGILNLGIVLEMKGKKYKYFDSDKWVDYGTSIGNTIGNFLPHRVISTRR